MMDDVRKKTYLRLGLLVGGHLIAMYLVALGAHLYLFPNAAYPRRYESLSFVAYPLYQFQIYTV